MPDTSKQTEMPQCDKTAVMPSLTHGSLFSGIGGFDLAAEWMGWENQFHCEWNPFGQKILKHYWPNAKNYEDITKTDFTIHRGRIHILSGGFPCQPYSSAGKRKGKEDERHLWPEMLRAIREIQPTYVVGENVRGLTNWNGGMVFDEVQADLENEGYEVTPFLLPSCGIGAIHQRERIWFIAYSKSYGNNKRSESYCGKKNTIGTDIIHQFNERFAITTSEFFKSAICPEHNGFSERLDGITISEWRKQSLKAAGNAIVPQVAFQIFKAIALHDASLSEA